eukprot:CAMPEP_0116149962 /NCGR_PEP_ID=MMETSP0329-20121206/19266_1 /TAXON_ID=697910 /ORGANISM="Pseudo-nitzschia arenysensis, Strain B593" /LENGTH=138 /DNA_ID=CAMNT_0003646389 /DNA_START=22 /DNA_END=435 /DNA_ORIENTATION=-
MFSVSRFDPRKADAPRKRSGSTDKKKKSKVRSADSRSDAKKKKKKRKRESKPQDGEENANQHKNVEEASATQITTDTPPATEAEVAAEKKIDETQDSTTSVPEEDESMTGTEPTTEVAFRVIAPETEGALSTKKNLTG